MFAILHHSNDQIASSSSQLVEPASSCKRGISIDETRRALVIVLPCCGALEIVGVIIIIIIMGKQQVVQSVLCRLHTCAIKNLRSLKF